MVRAWRGERIHMKAWVCLLWGSKLYKLQNQPLTWKNEGTVRRGTVHDVWPNLVTCVPSSRSSATQQSTNIVLRVPAITWVAGQSYSWWGTRNGVLRVEIWRWKFDGPGWKVLDCDKKQQCAAKSRLVPRGRCPEEGADMPISLIWGQGYTIHVFIAKNMRVRNWWVVPYRALSHF